jgi:hypothetical protein
VEETKDYLVFFELTSISRCGPALDDISVDSVRLLTTSAPATSEPEPAVPVMPSPVTSPEVIPEPAPVPKPADQSQVDPVPMRAVSDPTETNLPSDELP